MTKQTYGALCALAEQHGFVMTEELRAFLRDVEEADQRAQPGADEVLRLHTEMAGLRQMLDAANARADQAVALSNHLQNQLSNNQAQPVGDDRAQQLEVFLWLADVVQEDAKKTRDRYPAQSERAEQLAAFMKTACKWFAQAIVAEAIVDCLKANAMPSFQVQVTTNPESASLRRDQIITVGFSSWDLLIEHVRQAAEQGAAR